MARVRSSMTGSKRLEGAVTSRIRSEKSRSWYRSTFIVLAGLGEEGMKVKVAHFSGVSGGARDWNPAPRRPSWIFADLRFYFAALLRFNPGMRNPILVALDVPTAEAALELVRELTPVV